MTDLILKHVVTQQWFLGLFVLWIYRIDAFSFFRLQVDKGVVTEFLFKS